jgi:hypothetical protein
MLGENDASIAAVMITILAATVKIIGRCIY